MSVQYTLPTAADLAVLSRNYGNAITISVSTSPVVSSREASYLGAKSAFDEAHETLKQRETPQKILDELRVEWQRVQDDAELWGSLSRSLAIFIAPGLSEVFVLPNVVKSSSQVGPYFALGAVFRALTVNQHAYGVLLSSNEWSLWRATETHRAERLVVNEDHPTDAADATNRDTVRGRDHARRLVGDEGKKVLIDRYTKRVAEAVTAELQERGDDGIDPIVVFGTEPVLGLFRHHSGQKNRIVCVEGAADRLTADEVDRSIRTTISAANAKSVSEKVSAMANETVSGLALDELTTIAKAAVAGAVKTFVFASDRRVLGTLDSEHGGVDYAEAETGGLTKAGEPAYDILSRIAVIVLEHGGEVLAVRSEEVTSDNWNGSAAARLRFTLA
jgi:hypothetical protein